MAVIGSGGSGGSATAATEFRGELRGDLTHHVDQMPGFTEIGEEVQRVAMIMTTVGADEPALLSELAQLQQDVTKGALLESARQLGDATAQEQDQADGDETR